MKNPPPPTHTRVHSDFDFTCDEEACYYEVRVFDGDESMEASRVESLRPFRMGRAVVLFLGHASDRPRPHPSVAAARTTTRPGKGL